MQMISYVRLGGNFEVEAACVRFCIVIVRKTLNRGVRYTCTRKRRLFAVDDERCFECK